MNNLIKISNKFKKDKRNEIHVNVVNGFNGFSGDIFYIDDNNILEMDSVFSIRQPSDIQDVNIVQITYPGNYKFHFNDILLKAIPYLAIFKFETNGRYSEIEKEINSILLESLPEETFYFISSYFQDAEEIDKIYVYSTEPISDILYDKINIILQLKI